MRRRGALRDPSPRVWVLGLVVLCFMGTLLGRLGQVQIAGHEDYQQAAASVNTRTVSDAAVRGRILDRSGLPLVDNTTETVVTVDRRVLVDAGDGGRDLVRRVAAVLGASFEQLWGRTQLCGEKGAPPAPVCWAGSAYVPIPLISGADPHKALSLLERPDLFPGVGVSAQPVRDYPAEQTVNAAHVLGYLARPTGAEVTSSKGAIGDLDLVGRSGLEQQYDAALRGTPGTTTVAVDPRGVVTSTLGQTAPVPGQDLVTNLDARVQATAEDALASAVAKARTLGYPRRLGGCRGPRRPQRRRRRCRQLPVLRPGRLDRWRDGDRARAASPTRRPARRWCPA